jgi:hypothetical protein
MVMVVTGLVALVLIIGLGVAGRRRRSRATVAASTVRSTCVIFDAVPAAKGPHRWTEDPEADRELDRRLTAFLAGDCGDERSRRWLVGADQER